MKIFRRLTLPMMLIGLIACSNPGGASDGTDDRNDEFPFSYIHSEFSFHYFDLPESWETVAVSSEFELNYQDLENPEDHIYGEIPYRYTFSFGDTEEENIVKEEVLLEYNETQKLLGSGHRQHYYHSYERDFGTLSISKNGFKNSVKNLENTEELIIHDHEILVATNETRWIANWHLNQSYYDLLIKEEADVQSIEELQKIIELIISE